MDNDSRGNIKNPQSNFIGPESRPRRPSKTQNAPIAPTQEKSNWNNNQCPPLPRSYTQTAASAHSTSNSQRTRSASSPCPPAKQESSGQPTVDPRHSSAKQQQSDSSIEIISKAAPTYTSHPTGNPSSVAKTSTSRTAVLLLGATGAGKSSFIKELTGQDVIVGNTMQSCTTECSPWEFQYNEILRVTLVDTPGFNDTDKPDLDILQSIANYITEDSSPEVCGIIFLHKIVETRLTGSSRLILDVLRQICGASFYPNVTIATTMWNTLPADISLSKFQHRQKEFATSAAGWGDMSQGGTKTVSYFGTRESALVVLQNVLSSQGTLQFGVEIMNGLLLRDTSAGKVLTEELRRREAKMREEHEEEMAEMKAELKEKQELLMKMDAEPKRPERFQSEYSQGGTEYHTSGGPYSRQHYQRRNAPAQGFTRISLDPNTEGYKRKNSIRDDLQKEIKDLRRDIKGAAEAWSHNFRKLMSGR